MAAYVFEGSSMVVLLPERFFLLLFHGIFLRVWDDSHQNIKLTFSTHINQIFTCLWMVYNSYRHLYTSAMFYSLNIFGLSLLLLNWLLYFDIINQRYENISSSAKLEWFFTQATIVVKKIYVFSKYTKKKL